MSDLILFSDAFSISPYAMSAFVALEEKGLDYQLVHVGMHTKEHLNPSYPARTGRVPSLRHGDFVLAESSAIAEYIDEVFAAPRYARLFPCDVKERAVAREVMAWLRSDLTAIREERPTTSIFVQRSKTPLTEQAQAAARRLIKAAQQLIGANKTTLFAEWCLADTDLSLMLQRLNLNGDDLPANLRAYAEANWQRPSVKKWLAHSREDYVPY